jgi:hypothetical protein
MTQTTTGNWKSVWQRSGDELKDFCRGNWKSVSTLEVCQIIWKGPLIMLLEDVEMKDLLHNHPVLVVS